MMDAVELPQPAQAAPGRFCPLRYRYGAAALSQIELRPVPTLYVIGGLYGNVAALDAIEQLVTAESTAARLCFNGDFNWFNIDDRQFAEINRRVLAHDAIQGNVEAEFDTTDESADAGCGCVYPDSVDAAVVARSNLIHAELKAVARRHPDLVALISQLPMVARYQVGDCRVGVVHGDAESLAGWKFDVSALDDAGAASWLQSAFVQAQVDVFASTHTCLPALRQFALANGPTHGCGWVVNNGAAGMPNFSGDLAGLCTRIALTPSPHPTLHEVSFRGAYVALLPVRFDTVRWQDDFLKQWPPGSPAWTSYFARISHGPAYEPGQAVNPGC